MVESAGNEEQDNGHAVHALTCRGRDNMMPDTIMGDLLSVDDTLASSSKTRT
jgi:hypothetical protein